MKERARENAVMRPELVRDERVPSEFAGVAPERVRTADRMMTTDGGVTPEMPPATSALTPARAPHPVLHRPVHRAQDRQGDGFHCRSLTAFGDPGQEVGAMPRKRERRRQ